MNISRNKLLHAMAFSAFSSILLLVGRIFISGHFTYSFLLWNLFLAWVPLILAFQLPAKTDLFSVRTILLLSGWLLFFPNAPYIITDLVHLHPKPNMPLWYDMVLLVSFAWNGLIVGFISLLKVQQYLSASLKTVYSWLFTGGILMLSSFGIYLGRFQRWNSWDIIAQPFALFADIWSKVLHPFANPQPVGVTLIFSVFLISSYLTFYYLARPEKQS